MAKQAVFTIEIDDELRDAFLAAASASNTPAAQVVRGLMRDFVENQKVESRKAAEEYEAFLAAKVARARSSITQGRTRADQDVERDFAARRAVLLGRAGGSGA